MHQHWAPGPPVSDATDENARRRPLTLLLVLVLLATAGLAGCGGDDPPPPPDVALRDRAGQTRFGVHMDLTFESDATRRQQVVAAARDVLAAQVSRNSLLWHKVEPVRGQRDWTVPDAVVGELTAARIEPLFAVYGSPPWATGTAADVPEGEMYVPTDQAAFDRWLADYAGFVRAAAERYRGRVTKWEVWNEPNQHFFWKPRPDPERYARLLTELARVLHEVDPANRVAVGGVTGVTVSPRGDVTGQRFVRRLLELGALRGVDAVGVHNYPGADQPPDEHIDGVTNFDDVAVIRAELLAHGANLPLWDTEWGWSANKVRPDDQARYVTRSLDLLVSRYPYVTVATVFIDHDRPAYPFGLLDGDLRPKPAANAFASFVRARQGRRS